MNEVKVLIAGIYTFICDECVSLCADICNTGAEEREQLQSALRLCMFEVSEPKGRKGVDKASAIALDAGCKALGITALEWSKSIPTSNDFDPFTCDPIEGDYNGPHGPLPGKKK
jgi:ATP-dependent protease Clp ATPase subunit